MTCIRGPPCKPGNTAELMRFAIASSLVRIMPPRGPRRVLCVVVVTTWAWMGSGSIAWRGRSQIYPPERGAPPSRRSEEHTSELQSLMRISYAVFCLKKKNKQDDDQQQRVSK